MRGLADGASANGASLNYTDVLLAHVVPDIDCYYGYGPGCNGFVVFGNATKDGYIYHGRSLDSSFVPSGEPVGLITVCEPANGTAFVNVGFPGIIGVYTGMSKEGITLELNLSSCNDTTLVGTPILFTSRKVLQYSNNLTEAFDIMSQTDRTTGWNVLLGDGRNLNACAIEISAHHCKLFWAGDQAENMPPYYYPIQDAVLRTNQYVDPELAATQRSPYDPTIISSLPNVPNWSWVRYAALRQWIEDNYGNITAEMSIGLLKTPPIACKGSLQSMVFGSTNLELWVANAANNTPAYAREFIYLSYDDLFPEVDLTITSTEGGNVTTPGEGKFTYDEGTVISLEAEPDEGYQFRNWTGNVGTIANVEAASTRITMNDNYSITANFEAEPPMTPVIGCFIATAAYGTPMAAEIQILREFRDEYLLTNPLGQGLVEVYYTISPPIADFITEHPRLKPIVRAELMPVVAMCSIVLDIVPQAAGNEA